MMTRQGDTLEQGATATVGMAGMAGMAAGAGGQSGLPGGSAALEALLDAAGGSGGSNTGDGVALGDVLAAWQREQDRLSNRAWRRPGGLARPAGL